LGPDLQIEYPVAGPIQEGLLLSGYVDLVSVTLPRVDVIDFKTDAPPQGSAAEVYRDYASQVRAYGRLLGEAGCVTGRQLRTGLLFSADGSIHCIITCPDQRLASGPRGSQMLGDLMSTQPEGCCRSTKPSSREARPDGPAPRTTARRGVRGCRCHGPR
jgi:hypothetical protein